jgi:hypothetical protein
MVSPGLVPGRVALAGALLVVVLAAALAVPGLQFQGSGRLRPPTARGGGAEADRGYQQGDQAGRTSRQRPPDEQAERGPDSRQGDPRGDPSSRDRTAGFAGPAASLIRLLTAAGKWLIIPLVLVIVLAALWALSRLWPNLANSRGRMAERWRGLLNRLAALLERFSRSARPTSKADPLANLEILAGLPSRDAVLGAYHRFLDLLESRGYPRPVKSTPYEVLNTLPFDFRPLADPARSLTELYVQAAYSGEPVEPGAREQAIFILKGMRGVLEKPAA